MWREISEDVYQNAVLVVLSLLEVTESMTRKKKSERRIGLRIALLMFVILSGLLVYDIYKSNHTFEVTNYEIKSDQIQHDFRVVQLSDLHDVTFGRENEDLVEAVHEQKPDLILITGDLVNSKQAIKRHKIYKTVVSESEVVTTLNTAMNLVYRLLQIAPVYISYGNQDLEVEHLLGVDFKHLFNTIGAVVLEATVNTGYVDLEINEQKIRLGGIYGHCLPEKFSQLINPDESDFLKKFQDTDRYTILMCHEPICWRSSGSLYDWNVDAVFSGHVHGGQIIIPGIGGVYAPDMGWFPGKLEGLFTTKEENFKEVINTLRTYGNDKTDNSYYEEERVYKPHTLVLSRGLGNTEIIPRINNLPEVVVVDFVPQL